MPKSDFARAVDQIQARLRPFLEECGHRVRGRTFNRVTEDGLTQVVNIQMGPSDPPGTTYIPGLRENFHGLFTVNLGIYVPEIDKIYGGLKGRTWVQDPDCCVRTRLHETSGEQQEIWWHARNDSRIIEEIRGLLETDGLRFLERFATRNKVISELAGQSRPTNGGRPPRIVMAIILAERGQKDAARTLLLQQVLDAQNHPRHADHVRELAGQLGLGDLHS